MLQYFISGYLFLYIFSFFTSKKIDYKVNIILSCVISYIFVSLTTSINLLTLNNPVLNNPFVISGISIILAIILGLLFSILFTNKNVNNFIISKFHKSLNDDIWRDVFDFDNGSNLKVFIKNEPYYLIGHYKSHEEKGNDSWIALKGFAKIDKESNLNFKSEPNYIGNDNVIITVRFNDIEHIEVF